MQSPQLSRKSPLVSTEYPRESPDSKASSPYSTGYPPHFFDKTKAAAPQIDKSLFFQATTERENENRHQNKQLKNKQLRTEINKQTKKHIDNTTHSI